LLPTRVVIGAFAFLFRFLPPVPLRWRHVWLAAALCAGALIVAAEVPALYGAYFGRSSAFGAIGGALAILLWMNLVSQLLFSGAELCKVVVENHPRWS
jgi:membrane protein